MGRVPCATFPCNVRRLAVAAAGLKASNRRQGRKRSLHALPALWLVSDDRRLPFLESALRAMPPACGCLLRHYRTPEAERLLLAGDIARLCRRRRHRLHYAVHAAISALPPVHLCAGLHVPSHALPLPALARWGLRRRLRRLALSCAVHNMAQWRMAQLLFPAAGGARACVIVLSPLMTRNTPSHGLRVLARKVSRVRNAPLPLALGGINAHNVRGLRHTAFSGLAAVSAFAPPHAKPKDTDAAGVPHCARLGGKVKKDTG